MTENGGSEEEKKTPWYLTRGTAVWGLLIAGPLALPLLWWSPKFKMTTKVTITLVTLILTYLSFKYTPVLIDRLTHQLAGLRGATNG